GAAPTTPRLQLLTAGEPPLTAATARLTDQRVVSAARRGGCLDCVTCATVPDTFAEGHERSFPVGRVHRPFGARRGKQCTRGAASGDAEPRLNTDLFAAVSAIPTEAVTGVIPPSCRRTVGALPAAVSDGADAVVDLGPWRPRAAVRHFVPSLSVLGASAFAFRFELAVKSTTEWSPWIANTTVGSAEFFPYPPVDGIESQIDLWASRAAVGEIKLRVRVRSGDAAALFDRPWLVTLSVCDGSDVGRMPPPGGSARLSVPAL